MAWNWRIVVPGVCVATVGLLAANLLWRSADRPSAGAPLPGDSDEAPTEVLSVAPPLSRQSDEVVSRADSGASVAPFSGLGSGADVLRRAEACLRPDLDDPSIDAADLTVMWRCLQAFDWSRVAPADLATWLCTAKRPLRQTSLVAGAILHARSPKEALAYLAEYSPSCLEVRETGLQMMAIEAIESADPTWVAELERSMTPDALFTGSSSTQGILLAELFIRRGNLELATVLENGGRGEYGGSDDEINRAAAGTLFLSSTSQWDPGRRDNAWAYAESLLYSPTTPPSVGSALATFLSSKQTWPGGDSTLALQTLSLAMDDARFGENAAAILFFTRTPEGPDGCDKALWDAIYTKVLAAAAENGWERPSK